MNYKRAIITTDIIFSHPLSMKFIGQKWYDDDECMWCDNRRYVSENIHAKVRIYEDGSCKLQIGDYYRFENMCMKKNMMPKLSFSSPRELVIYFLTDSLFELPSCWQDYMENTHTITHKYINENNIKRFFAFNNFYYCECRGLYMRCGNDNVTFVDELPTLPQDITSTYGYKYDKWSEMNGYVIYSDKLYPFWNTPKLVYNTEHNVDFYLNKFDDFNIFNELDFYKFIKDIDEMLDYNEVYNKYYYRFYNNAKSYKDSDLDFNEVYSAYVAQCNDDQQAEIDALNRQIAELEAKRNNCFRAFG